MFGNIAAGVRADPREQPPARLAGERVASGNEAARPPTPKAEGARRASASDARIVQQRVQEVIVNTPHGPVVLRRTVTDEVRGAPRAG